MANEKRLIDADGVLDLFTAQAPSMNYNKMFMTVANAPTVDAVEVVHGRWLIHKGHFHDFAECSLCGEDYGKDTAMAMNYFPNCGAKMDGGKDNGKNN